MSPEEIFKLCNAIALIGWLILIIASPFWFNTDKFLIGIVVTLLCIVYAWGAFTHLHADDLKKFGTLNGVVELFGNPKIVLTGWVHYLAFDLMTGIWIKKNAQKYNISHWILIPCLLFTFMLGPVGLLLYLLIRTVKTGNYFADNH